MTTLIGILKACGCNVRPDGWVLMSEAARGVLVAAGQRDALECQAGIWFEVRS